MALREKIVERSLQDHVANGTRNQGNGGQYRLKTNHFPENQELKNGKNALLNNMTIFNPTLFCEGLRMAICHK
jgi:hypothetical protein